MNKQNKSVTVIGDSLLKGIIFNENKNVYNVLKDNCISLLKEEEKLNINDYSMCGLNVENLNKYFNLVLKQTNDQIIILEIGTDSFEQDLLTNEFKPLYSVKKYKKVLKKIIRTSTKDAREIVLTTIPYISNQKFYEFNMNKTFLTKQMDVLEINNYIEKINNVIKQLSSKYNIFVIDLNKGINSFDTELYSVDGKYLSVKGHKTLKDIFVESIKKSSIYSI